MAAAVCLLLREQLSSFRVRVQAPFSVHARVDTEINKHYLEREGGKSILEESIVHEQWRIVWPFNGDLCSQRRRIRCSFRCLRGDLYTPLGRLLC